MIAIPGSEDGFSAFYSERAVLHSMVQEVPGLGGLRSLVYLADVALRLYGFGPKALLVAAIGCLPSCLPEVFFGKWWNLRRSQTLSLLFFWNVSKAGDD